MVAVAASAGAEAATPPYRCSNTNNSALQQLHRPASKIWLQLDEQLLHLAAADLAAVSPHVARRVSNTTCIYMR